MLLVESQPAQDAPALLLLVLEDPGGQRRHPDLLDREVPHGKRGQPALVLSQCGLDDLELLLHDRQLAAVPGGHHRGAEHLGAGRRDDHIERGAALGVQQVGAEAAVARDLGAVGPTGRIQQAQVGHARGLGQQPRLAHGLHDGVDLLLARQGEVSVGSSGAGGGVWGGHGLHAPSCAASRGTAPLDGSEGRAGRVPGGAPTVGPEVIRVICDACIRAGSCADRQSGVRRLRHLQDGARPSPGARIQ